MTAGVGCPPTTVPTTADPSTGLSSAEAARRLAEVGANELRRAEATPPWRIFADQLTSPVVVLMLGAVPALALVVDPPEADVMRRPPRPPAEPILGRAEWREIALTGALQTAVTFGVFAWALDGGLARARSLAFAVLVFVQLFRSFASRSTTRVFWQVGAFSNLVLLAVVIASIAFQLAIHSLPLTRDLFDITALTPLDAALCLALGVVPVTVVELAKLVRAGRRVRTDRG